MVRDLVDPMASVRAYLAAEKSNNTKRAYASDFAAFNAWCDGAGEPSLPAAPLSVAKYIAQLADSGLKASTITRRIAAIRYAHRAAGHEPPTNSEGVKAVMRGIRRKLGSAVTRKAPATAAALRQMLEQIPTNLQGKRDRALLLLCFAAALRRSELVALNVDDIERFPAGIVVTLRSSKTDQEGRGRRIPVPRGKKLKPVEALDAWLTAAAILSGPIFREVDRHGNVGKNAISDRSVARVIKRWAAAAGFDPDQFSGHSPRAGFVTQALEDKIDPLKIMGITGHAKVDTLKIYDRREVGLKDHAGKGFL